MFVVENQYNTRILYFCCASDPRFLGKSVIFFFVFSAFFGRFSRSCKFFFLPQFLVQQRVFVFMSDFSEKKFLQFEKRSYLCTRFRGNNSSFREKRKDIEFLDREIACVEHRAGEAGGWDTNESKVKKSNSYNEEFDPGSG